jgi:hypothetical protein
MIYVVSFKNLALFIIQIAFELIAINLIKYI